MSNKRLRVGLIGGGGPNAFFAHAHEKAIHLDGTREVVAGALRSDPDEALEAADNWPYPIHGYGTWQEMLADAENERLDYVTIVTPNHAHFGPALAFIKADVPVFCEKPMTLTVGEARELEQVVIEREVPFALAHTYLGHWTLRLARRIVRSGIIGTVRWVDASYLQGWLADPIEQDGQQQASWRTDPARAGASCCGGDIATHAHIALRYVTGLEASVVSARLPIFVEGRQLDDHFTAYCHLDNGGEAIVRASQISVGHKNDHGLEVVGDKGTLIWHQEESEKLVLCLKGYPDLVYWRGAVGSQNAVGKWYESILGELPAGLMAEPTLPAGHSEGFHDALARLHRSFERVVRAYNAEETWACDGSEFANVTDGRIGMEFIAAAVAAGAKN